MNSATRLVFSLSKYNTTQSLSCSTNCICWRLRKESSTAHSLFMRHTICLYLTAPLYVADEFLWSSDLEARGHHRRTRLLTVGDRAFTVDRRYPCLERPTTPPHDAYSSFQPFLSLCLWRDWSHYRMTLYVACIILNCILLYFVGNSMCSIYM